MTAKFFGANGEGRTPMPLRALEPKSRASANSATFARGERRGDYSNGHVNLTLSVLPCVSSAHSPEQSR